MDFLFDNLGTAIDSWNNMTLLIIGIPFSLIGLMCIGFWFWWRIFAQRFQGKISTVQVSGKSKIKQRKDEAERSKRYDNHDRYDHLDTHRKPDKKYSTSVVERSHRALRSTNKDRKYSSGKKKGVSGNKKEMGKGGAYFMLVFAMIFIGIGGYFGYSYLSLASNGYQTVGVIADFKESYDSEDGYTYYAIVEYRDSSGRMHRNADKIGKGNRSYLDRRGEQVEIYYDPNKPDRFAIVGFWHNMLLPIMFCIIPLVFVVMAVAVINGKAESDLGFNDENDTQNYKRASNNTHKYNSEMYYPVFEYVDRNGQRQTAYSPSGSNMILNKIPGSEVTLFVRPKTPNEAVRAGYFSLILGLILLIPGGFMSYMGFRNFEINLVSVVMFFGMIAFVGYRIFSKFENVDEVAKKAWQEKQKNRPSRLRREHLPELGVDEVRHRVNYHDKISRQTSYVFGIVAIGLLVGSFIWAQNYSEFASMSYSTTGYVEDITTRRNRSSSDHQVTYYSQVRFVAADGRRYKFRDDVGSSVKMHEIGQEVKVLYDPSSPRDAIIDRGILNYLPQLGMAFFGGLLLLSVLSRMLKSRARRFSRYPSY